MRRVCFALTLPLSAIVAEHGRRRALIGTTLAIFGFGLLMRPLYPAGTLGALLTMAVGLSLMG